MYEHRRPLLSRARFLRRLALHGVVATALPAGSWLIVRMLHRFHLGPDANTSR